MYDFLLAHYYAQFAHPYPTLFQVELEKDGCKWVDMLWCQGAQNIGQP